MTSRSIPLSTVAIRREPDILLARQRGRQLAQDLGFSVGDTTRITTALSELESRVLALYLDGHSYEEVGHRLGCDCKTVDNALQRVKRKVGAHLMQRAVPA